MILRHFDDTHTPEIIAAMPHFDGFVWQEGHPVETIASELAITKRAWLYFEVCSLPAVEWPDPLPAYLAFKRFNAPVLRHPDTGEPIINWGGRHSIDFSIASTTFLIDLALAIRDTLRRFNLQYGAFLDNTFPLMQPWMIPDHYALFSPEKWLAGEVNFYRFLTILDALDIQTMCNGEREIPGRRLYCEYANLSWNRDLTIWRNDDTEDHPLKLDHVLSVEALDEAAVDRVISNHRYDTSRWIAFSTRTSAGYEAVEAAYRLAAL